METHNWLVQQFEAERPRLQAMAYRMLGEQAEAEDAVPFDEIAPLGEFFPCEKNAARLCSRWIMAGSLADIIKSDVISRGAGARLPN